MRIAFAAILKISERVITLDTMAIVFGIGTILTSGLVSSVVTYRLNRNKAQFEFMREKAEKLYLSAHEYGIALSSHGLTYFPVLKGEIDWNQMLDLHIKSTSNKEHGGAETMTMLVEIYFPSVRPALAEVFSARDDFNTYTTGLKHHYRAYGDVTSQEFKAPFMKKLDRISGATAALQDSIVKAARAYAGVRQE